MNLITSLTSRLKIFFLTCKLLSVFVFAIFAFSQTVNGESGPTPINLYEELEKASNEALLTDLANTGETESVEPEEVVSPESRYQIELLIFAYVKTGEENSEVWRNLTRPSFDEYFTPIQIDENTNNSQGLLPNLPTPAPRIFLDTEKAGLSEFKGMIKKMEINGQYRILKHLLWQQAVLPEEAQDFIYIRGGNNYPFEDHLADMAASKPMNGRLELPEQNLKALGQHELEGIIRIHLSRFLHIRSDLWFTQYAQNDAGQCKMNDAPDVFGGINQALPPNLSYTPLLNFRLNQNRRLRSHELHYLDHPRFGLLIKFTPVKPI